MPLVLTCVGWVELSTCPMPGGRRGAMPSAAGLASAGSEARFDHGMIA